MGIINSMFAKLKSNNQENSQVIAQQADPNLPDPQITPNPPQAPIANTSSSTPQANPAGAMQRYKTLETQLTGAQVLHTKPIAQPLAGVRKFGKRLMWAGILIGIPAGILYVVNLPYPVIRQPIAKFAPLLLLPSNMSMEENFKRGQATVEESRQLIESPTSIEDLDRGSLKLKEGKAALDAIPAWYVADWADYSRGYYGGWGYDWRFSPAGLQSARIKAGQLEAKVFQEKNAQTALTNAEQELAIAKAKFQEAKQPVDKKTAVQNWQGAIDRLGQIPAQTMAGRRAQQLVTTASRDLQNLGGLAAGNVKVLALISGAEEFAKKAAEAGRNPPHTSDRWQETAQMWQQAIDRLEDIPASELQGYTEVQKQLANYRASLSDVKVRLKNEQESLQALESANQNLARLWASLPKDGKDFNKNQAIAGFLTVKNDLDKVKSGTTVYLKAQETKMQVEQQLKLLQSGK